jgi:hypothetical protein
MKMMTLALALAALAGPAAAGADIRAFDLDGDRFVTFGELLASAPDVTRSEFTAIDLNSDRRLSANELSGAAGRTLVTRLRTSAVQPQGALVALPPARVADIDGDRDGRITFDELHRIDSPYLGQRLRN